MGTYYAQFLVSYMDGTSDGATYQAYIGINTKVNTSLPQVFADLESQILNTAATQGFTGFSASDIVYFEPGLQMNLLRAFATPSRSLNSAFIVSTTRDAQVQYSVDIATSLSLTTGAVGTVFLEYADDSGFTTNVKEVQRFVSGNTGTLVVGLALNQIGTAAVGGIIPAGKYVRLRTANTTGSPTFTYRSAQEVLL